MQMRALFEGGYYSSIEGKRCGYNSRAATIKGRALLKVLRYLYMYLNDTNEWKSMHLITNNAAIIKNSNCFVILLFISPLCLFCLFCSIYSNYNAKRNSKILMESGQVFLRRQRTTLLCTVWHAYNTFTSCKTVVLKQVRLKIDTFLG